MKLRRLWVFFDQFNTTDELSYIKQMIIDRRFQGEPLPQNVVLLAACNPYRKKQEKKTIKAGIKKSNDSGDGLAFRVKAPCLSLVQFMWDYQQLGDHQNQQYISKMLETIQYAQKKKLVKAVIYTHSFFRKNIQISSISLRDVARFKELFLWFEKYMPSQRQQYETPQYTKRIDQNFCIQRSKRAVSLTFAFCYSLRLASNQQRKNFLKQVDDLLGFQMDFTRKIINNQQIDYINRLKCRGAKIALNQALRENVFTTLVCLINKIPLLIIGNPGSSKSLSIKMISSNLRGQNSPSTFCQQFPEFNIIYFQGSESCTSKGVESVFEKAIRSKQEFDQKKSQNSGNMQNCILFDQIGLAQNSVHNPLKVLHSQLETNKKKVAFIGVSNWELDAAKMSRFLILARSNPDLEELKETAILIYQSYFPSNNQKNNIISNFQIYAKYYFQFLKEWDSNRDNKQGFFGLRDFYNYIKYICQAIKNQGIRGSNHQQLQNSLFRSIQINFDGQPNSVQQFKKIAKINPKKFQLTQMNPIQIVQQNLKNPESRCLLLIVKGDALIPIINNSITNKNPERRVVCIYGSTFKDDQESEEYNLEITSVIISHISRGNILAFKDINNSIQTSLYDLFNKSFYEVGGKKYCRIAVGANSNPKCLVHNKFNAIVYMDERTVVSTELAFLNRFQKHYLNFGSMITLQEKRIVQQIDSWIKQVLAFKEKTKLKQQHYLVNSCIQSIATLVIKFRGKNDLKRQIKKKLLQNRTMDFQIARKQNKIPYQLQEQISQIIKQEIPFKQSQNKNLIFYTYDQSSQTIGSSKLIRETSERIRLAEVKRQKQIRTGLQNFFKSEKQELNIYINYHHEWQHINLVLYLVNFFQEEKKSSKVVKIVIQLQRFTLVALQIDHVNISYLHNFEQYFIQDLINQNETAKLLQINNYYDIYQKLYPGSRPTDFNAAAQLRFKLFTEKQNESDLIKMYFQSSNKLLSNQIYLNASQRFLKNQLIKKKIQFDYILQNAEDVLKASNVKEAIELMVKQILIDRLCHYFYRIIETNLIFNFIPSQYISTFLEKKILKIQQFHKKFQNDNQNIYKKVFEDLLQQMVVKKGSQVTKKFAKGIQSNPIKIYYPTLLPLAHKQLAKIFKINQWTNDIPQLIENNSHKLFQSHFSQNQDSENQRLIAQTLNSIRDAFGKTRYRLSEEKNIWKMMKSEVGKGLFLSQLFLFDSIQSFCKEAEIQCTYVYCLTKIFSTSFDRFNIEDKLIILTLDRNFWQNAFLILAIIMKRNQKKFQQMVKFFNIQMSKYYQVEIQQKNTNSQYEKQQNNESMKNRQNHIFPKTLIKFGNILSMYCFTVFEFRVQNIPQLSEERINYLKLFNQIIPAIRTLIQNYDHFGVQISQQFLTTMKFMQLIKKSQSEGK